MHAPEPFAQREHEAIASLIAAYPLATLVRNGEAGPVAAHAPLCAEFGPDGDIKALIGHVAKANPFWRSADGAPVLAVFAGPDAYVSPSAYASKAAHGKVVPTWNYMRAEARGALRVVAGAEREHVARVTEIMERSRPAPWRVDDAPAEYVDRLLGAIVAVRLDVEAVTGVWKLSQNRSAEDYAGVAADLETRMDPQALEIAQVMHALRMS